MLSSARTSSAITWTWIGVGGAKAPVASVEILGNPVWICNCLGPWRRRLCPSLDTETNVGISLDRLRAAIQSLRAACANTIVASRIPKMNKTWKVVVIPDAVVAIETSIHVCQFCFFN